MWFCIPSALLKGSVLDAILFLLAVLSIWNWEVSFSFRCVIYFYIAPSFYGFVFMSSFERVGFEVKQLPFATSLAAS